MFDTQSEISLVARVEAFQGERFRVARLSARQMRAKGTAERESSCFMTVASVHRLKR